jgi:pilus assembly protein CpaF
MEGDVITLQDIFLFDYGMGYDENGFARGALKSTGLRPKFLDKLHAHGLDFDPAIFAFEKFVK